VVSHASLVALLLASYGGMAQLFPVLLATFYWKRATMAGVMSGLVAGVGVNCIFLVLPTWRPVPLHEGVYGLAANILLLVVVSLLTQPQPVAKAEQYVEPGWD
jgi:SSS family solute:Na+ symporter